MRLFFRCLADGTSPVDDALVDEAIEGTFPAFAPPRLHGDGAAEAHGPGAAAVTGALARAWAMARGRHPDPRDRRQSASICAASASWSAAEALTTPLSRFTSALRRSRLKLLTEDHHPSTVDPRVHGETAAGCSVIRLDLGSIDHEEQLCQPRKLA